jgi:myosin-1
MQQLMKNLLSKTPNYIRCVKPNDEKSALNFDKNLVLNQVRYLGLLENIRVRRAGFAHRLTYDEFFNRYKMLSPETWPKTKLKPIEATKKIVLKCEIPEKEYAYGFSKIFIRSPNIIFELEELRRTELVVIISKIQAQWRMFAMRKKYKTWQKAQVTIAAKWRCYRSGSEIVPYII